MEHGVSRSRRPFFIVPPAPGPPPDPIRPWSMLKVRQSEIPIHNQPVRFFSPPLFEEPRIPAGFIAKRIEVRWEIPPELTDASKVQLFNKHLYRKPLGLDGDWRIRMVPRRENPAVLNTPRAKMLNRALNHVDVYPGELIGELVVKPSYIGSLSVNKSYDGRIRP